MVVRVRERGAVRRAALSGVAFAALSIALSAEASASCVATGAVHSATCPDPNFIEVRTDAGATTLTVTDETVIGIDIAPVDSKVGPTTHTVTIDGTTVVNNPNYSGVYSETFAADHDLSVTIGADVKITSNGGFGGVWLRNDTSGDIAITSAATVSATGGPGITVTTNNGSVSLTNDGHVTSVDDRGLYADGGYNNGTSVPVTIVNNGTVDAYLAGARAIDYNGTASITNTGTITSATRQGMVAWSSMGDVELNNSGTVTAHDDNGLHAMSEYGDVTVTNSGTIRAYDDTKIVDSGIGRHTGIYAWAETSGDITVTNALAGDIVAGDDFAILAQTASGNVSVSNFGSLTGTGGIVATATVGNVSVTNSGTIIPTSTTDPVAVALKASGTGSFINTDVGTVTGGFTTKGGTNTINNDGTWNLLPSGVTSASWALTGTTDFVDGGTFTVSGGSATITGLRSFTVGSRGLLKVDTSSSLTLTGTTVDVDGTLQVLAGATLSTGAANVSPSTPSKYSGAAEVTGAGATWTIDGRLGVGVSSAGTLTVSDGGTVSSQGAIVGWNASGKGTVTVTGKDSTWTNTGDLYIGNEGVGEVTVSAGGKVEETGTLYVAAGAGSSGTLTVDGAGSSFTSQDRLYVGFAGKATGTLIISDGGSVSDAGTNIADGLGASGSATVTGKGSTWTNTGSLYVGQGGVGTLLVSDGGTVTSTVGAIGNTVQASGSSATVTGAGSSWTSSNPLYVGIHGDATLSVEAGGKVDTGGAVIGRHSKSSATVTGSGSSWSTGALVIGGDAADPGTDGTGTLTVTAGGAVTSTTARLGDVDGSTGIATVSGSGSTWTLSDRIGVGTSGSGELTVSNGGKLASTGGIVGWEATATGTATVTGTGSTWTNTGVLFIGNLGDGDLTVSSGGVVTSTDGYVGTENGSTSTATITGAGSAWTMSGDFLAGHNTGASGTVTVSAGGSMSSLQAILGDLVGSTGTMTVTGAGSTVTATSDFNVGRFGTGSLTLSDGATLNSYRSYLGNEVGSSGTVVMTGAGTSWTTTRRLFVGTDGDGTLTLSNGARISASGLVIGWGEYSTGVLNVGAAAGQTAAAAGILDVPAIAFGEGNGKLVFNFTDSLTVAAAISGAGAVELHSGALTLAGDSSYSGGTTVSGGTLTLATSTAAGTGTITLAGASTLAYADGITVANTLDVTGSATLDVATGKAVQAGAITGSGSYVVTGGGTLYFTGGASGFTGTTTVDDATTLSVNGNLGGSVDVTSGGVLKGSGSVGAATVASGGTIAPGNSIGTLTVVGNFAQSAGSTYEVELGAAGASDLIAVGGSATVAGSLAVSSATGYSIGTRYTILTAGGGVTGTYSAFDGSTLSYFTAASVVYDPNAIYLDVVKTRSFASVGATPNQIATAAGLDSAPQGGALVTAVARSQTAAVARQAFDGLSGELHATVVARTAEDTRIAETAAIDRIRAAFGSVGASRAPVAQPLGYGPAGKPADPAAAALVAPTTPEFAVWTRAFGSRAKADGNGNAAEVDQSLGGFLIGGDASFSDGAGRVGALVGYARGRTSVDDRASRADTDDYHFGLYAGRQWGALALRAGGSFTVRDVSSRRQVSVGGLSERLQANYTATVGRIFGELGWGIRLSAVDLEPFVGADLAHVETWRHTEKGGAAALTTDAKSAAVGFVTVGLRASKDFSVSGLDLALRGALAWRHAFGDTEPTVTQSFAGSSTFDVAGIGIGRDALVVEAGFDVALGRSASLGVTWDGRFGDKATSQTGRVALGWKF
jgi:outer membrane autotransporter protein